MFLIVVRFPAMPDRIDESASGKNGNRGSWRRRTGSLWGLGCVRSCRRRWATTVTFNYTGAPSPGRFHGVTSATFNLYEPREAGFGPGSSVQGGRGGWARATIPVTKLGGDLPGAVGRCQRRRIQRGRQRWLPVGPTDIRIGGRRPADRVPWPAEAGAEASAA